MVSLLNPEMFINKENRTELNIYVVIGSLSKNGESNLQYSPNIFTGFAFHHL